MTFTLYLGLYLFFNGLQLLINLLDLPHHGRLGLFKGRELPFSLVSHLLHVLKLLTGGFVLLEAEGNGQTNSVLWWPSICPVPSYAAFYLSHSPPMVSSSQATQSCRDASSFHNNASRHVCSSRSSAWPSQGSWLSPSQCSKGNHTTVNIGNT